jgi:hypothetical protein
MKNILETKGDSPRVFRNTIFFLCPSEAEKSAFLESVKRRMAYQQIRNDKTIKLTEEQRREIDHGLKKEEDDQYDKFRRYYRILCIPAKGSNTAITAIKELDMGIATWGEKKGIAQEAYDKLRAEGEILEKVSPLVIRERYLKEKDFVKIQQIYDSMMKTPGEVRYVSRSVIDSSIQDGVKQGLFGIGHLSGNGNGKENPTCLYYKEEAAASAIDGNNAIISSSLCQLQKTGSKPEDQGTGSVGVVDQGGSSGSGSVTSLDGGDDRVINIRDQVNLAFDIPRGKVSQIMGVMNLLQQKFESLHVEIRARDGSITEDDYVNKIKEALRQLGIRID